MDWLDCCKRLWCNGLWELLGGFVDLRNVKGWGCRVASWGEQVRGIRGGGFFSPGSSWRDLLGVSGRDLREDGDV